jgi:predicted DNA-binding transcriptional regulator AlpA
MLRPWYVCTLLGGINNTTLWAMRKAGEFPPPLQLTEGVVAWPEEEVLAWIKSRPRAAF